MLVSKETLSLLLKVTVIQTYASYKVSKVL